MNKEVLSKRAELLKAKNLSILKIDEERICTLCGSLTKIALINNGAREYYCSRCVYVRANNII